MEHCVNLFYCLYVIAYFSFLFCYIVVTLCSVRVCGFVSLVFCNLLIANVSLTVVQITVALLLWTDFQIPFLVINVDCICVLFIAMYLCILL